jgi:hypothetical protein
MSKLLDSMGVGCSIYYECDGTTTDNFFKSISYYGVLLSLRSTPAFLAVEGTDDNGLCGFSMPPYFKLTAVAGLSSFFCVVSYELLTNVRAC